MDQVLIRAAFPRSRKGGRYVNLVRPSGISGEREREKKKKK